MAGSQRIKALDLLRGLTVAAMILVNNAGGPVSYATLRHSDWNGLTLSDMVFPAFLFIMGASACLSLGKQQFAYSWPLMRKIIKRTVLILLIGWAIYYFNFLCKADFLPFAHFRLTGVLPRIAVCYFIVSLMAIGFGRKAICWITAVLLLAYGLILHLGNGLVPDETNVVVAYDRALLGSAHLYAKQIVDPEGLVSTLGAVCNSLIGFLFGFTLANKNLKVAEKAASIMAWGFALLLIGWAVESWLPINKRVWTPSFALVSCGLAALALGAFAFITDVKGKNLRCNDFLQVFGVNPLFLYVLSEVVAIVLSRTGAKKVIYAFIVTLIPDACIASLCYSLAMVVAMWAVGYVLYKRKIFIKI